MTVTIQADEAFDVAIKAIRSGGIVAYPTETSYGLAVDPSNKEAVAKLFELKGRSDKNPISLIVNDIEMARGLVKEVPPPAKQLMDRFWPGPLTIIFNAADTIPKTVTAGTGKIGLRVSSSLAATRLVTQAGVPITATSANPTGLEPAQAADQVARYFGDDIDVIIDGGILTERAASTVVDVTKDKPVIIREGKISKKDLEENL